MEYNKENLTLDRFFLGDKIFLKMMEYRINIMFLSILISYIVYVSPLYAAKSNLFDLFEIILVQSVGMMLILHLAVTIYSSSFGSLLKLWGDNKNLTKERVLLNRYNVKVVFSDALCKTLLVFFISSIFLNQDSSLIIMATYFFIVKFTEIKRAFNKKYSELFFSMIISLAVLLISISFISSIVLSAIQQ